MTFEALPSLSQIIANRPPDRGDRTGGAVRDDGSLSSGQELFAVEQSPETSTAAKHLLAAQSFRADPRIAEARRLISEAVAEHASSLTSTRGTAGELAGDYEACYRGWRRSAAARRSGLISPRDWATVRTSN